MLTLGARVRVAQRTQLCSFFLTSAEELARVNFEEMKHDKDRIIAAKNLEIQELKAKMEEMAQETLDKMRERIEITNTSFENDGGSLPMMRRLEEFNLGSPTKS